MRIYAKIWAYIWSNFIIWNIGLNDKFPRFFLLKIFKWIPWIWGSVQLCFDYSPTSQLGLAAVLFQKRLKFVFIEIGWPARAGNVLKLKIAIFEFGIPILSEYSVLSVHAVNFSSRCGGFLILFKVEKQQVSKVLFFFNAAVHFKSLKIEKN